MAGNWGRFLLLALFFSALASYGGVLPWARPTLIAAAGLTALVVAVGIGKHCRPVALSWVVALFVPPMLLAALQLSALVGTHPWVAADATLFGAHPALSLNPDATFRFLCWTTGVAAVAGAAAIAFRGHRQQQLVQAVVGLAAFHALIALLLLVSGLDLPYLPVNGRARGTFIYTNHAAALWGACLPMAMVLVARVHRRWLVAVAVLIVALVLSSSRGGILTATVVSAPFAWFLLPRRRRLLWAAGGSVLLAGYLTVIGIELTTERFERLVQTEEGINLSGRVVLMQHGAELAREAGPLGSGAGSTETVFWRNGSTPFDNFRVDHLHSDPVEWWLEFGWIGVLAAVVGGSLAAFSLRDHGAGRTSVNHEDHTRRLLRVAAALGLVDLLLHCLADFIFHLEALALLAALLLAVLAAGTKAAQESPPRSSWKPRLFLSLLGLVALLAAAVLTPQEGEMLLAKRTREALRFRLQHPELPLRPAIEQALAVPEPHFVALLVARLRARNDLAQMDAVSTDSAQLDLIQLEHIVPGQPEAWAERLRGQLAGRTFGGPAMAETASRLLAQAPGWPFGRLLLCTASSRLPAADNARLASAVLALGTALPDPAWPMLATALGRSALASWLEQNGNVVQVRSALAWMRGNARARVWHAAWVRCTPTGGVTPAQAILRRVEGSNRDPSSSPAATTLPLDPGGRWAMAESFARAGLPQPAGLAEALTRDGEPWSLWAVPPDLYQAAERARIMPVIGRYLDLPWTRAALAEADLAALAASGRTSGVGPQSDPRLINVAIAAAKGAEADRLALCLHSRRDPSWQQGAGGQWAWTWWYAEAGGRINLPTSGWVGVWVDGHWWAWSADHISVTATLPPGLHRIVVVTPD